MTAERMRKLLIAGIVALGCVLAYLPTIHAYSDKDYTSTNPAVQEAQRKQFADKVSKSYNFAFGKGNISLPGNGAVVGNTFLQPGIAIRRRTISGSNRCIATRSARRFTGPA